MLRKSNLLFDDIMDDNYSFLTNSEDKRIAKNQTLSILKNAADPS